MMLLTRFFGCHNFFGMPNEHVEQDQSHAVIIIQSEDKR